MLILLQFCFLRRFAVPASVRHLKDLAAEVATQHWTRCHHHQLIVNHYRRQGKHHIDFKENNKNKYQFCFHNKCAHWRNLPLKCSRFFDFFLLIRYRVVMMGDAGTGKTALVSQFMTSEYMHTYDASLGVYI